MLSKYLPRADVRRVARVIAKLEACGFQGALTGGLAIEAQMHLNRRTFARRPLNDLDFVVESFESICEPVAKEFVAHHVHPRASAGKLLVQLIEPEQRVRVDIFRQFGDTLRRKVRLRGQGASIDILSVEDLLARATSSLVASLQSKRSYEAKCAEAFRRLDGLGEGSALESAWRDHRQCGPPSFAESVEIVRRLLPAHPELAVRQHYSADITPCAKCEDCEPFVRANPESIVAMLGYW
jgi:hypothetical protein